jgi:hypothetical protein
MRGEPRRIERFEAGVAGQPHVERCQLRGRFEQ